MTVALLRVHLRLTAVAAHRLLMLLALAQQFRQEATRALLLLLRIVLLLLRLLELLLLPSIALLPLDGILASVLRLARRRSRRRSIASRA